jgi:cytochrome P450
MGIFTKRAALGTPIDVTELLMDLFFDVISDLTLGESFRSLETSKRSPVVREFLKRQKIVGFALLNTWVLHFLRSIKSPRKHEWYANALRKRKQVRQHHILRLNWLQKMTDISPDLYTYLSQSETFDVDGIHEAQLAIIAGADTNAITVSNICYLLCQHLDYQQKLFKEISSLSVHEDIIDDHLLIGKPYLSSIINETLRLYPPVPGGLQRLTPPEGAIIAGRYIPGNIVVSTPTFAIQRGMTILHQPRTILIFTDPRSFVRPDEFVPERWTSQPDLIIRRDAFVPFSYGAYSCAGKPLAMMQLRMVVAMIVRKFELSFAPDQQKVYERYIQGQADCFTLHLHPLPLILKERASKD